MITENYTHFFKALEENNTKEWFHLHKKDYEQYVKKSFLELLESLIPYIKQLEPNISINPKDALFRINRDVRFSKDKTPYNTIMKAGFSPDGKKSFLPGFYLGIGAEYIHIGGGLFNLKAPELKKVRLYIKNHPNEFNKIIHAKPFINTFGGLFGDKAKRLDKEFLEIQQVIPEIVNKQFYTMKKLPISDYLSTKKIEEVIVKHFKEINYLNQFLKKAF